MTSIPVRTSERDLMAASLLQVGVVRVPLDSLLQLWAQAAPRMVGQPGSLPALLSVVHDLAEHGVIALPAGAWDRSHTPPLPRFVTVRAARRAPGDKPWRRFPWRPDLGWVASLRTLGPKQFAQLVAVNDWLTSAAGTEPTVVPHRFRSAEVFGDEKALDILAKTTLFGTGRLSYEMLSCTRYAAPLPAAAVGDGPDVLVIENSDPYWVAVDTLRTCSHHQVGAVVWGCGETFPSQVTSLAVDVAGRGPASGQVWYWGDLDPTGMRIATAAAQEARRHGVADVRPALGLWDAYVDCEIRQAGRHTWTDIGRSWLGLGTWDRFAAVREAAGRVPQEAVPISTIEQWATTRQ